MGYTLIGLLRRVLVLVTFVIGCTAPGYAAPWFSYGPDGGDARAFAADPKDPAHLYMGAENGWLFQTHDGGKTWQRLAQLANRDDLVIDNILVDAANPNRLIAGTWVLGDLGHPDGGVYISEDGGATWATVDDMKGQSVRALIAAPSDATIMLAGTLVGVFRSTDSGAHWQRISPVENKEIHEVESLAVDPTNPKTIYAGTWHLPWKTTDGGATWSPMNQGLIEDSDIFSIIVDAKTPSIVYLSACSGIYKSVDAGGTFIGGVSYNKKQGIPVDARRTRVLMQDPNHPDTVYAGTTEGLYRTTDAGQTWKLKTAPDVIVNDVYVDPSNSDHMLLATDRGGVLMSMDGAGNFAGSNDGFSTRQVSAFTADSHDPAVVYVGVVNDKTMGGVFMSKAGGMSWTHVEDGLAGNDVNGLIQAPDGGILAGTGHGIYKLQKDVWKREGTAGQMVLIPAVQTVAATSPKPAPVKSKAGKTSAGRLAASRAAAARRRPATKRVRTYVDEDVYGFAGSGSSLFAATSSGLLTSTNDGQAWYAVEGIPQQDWHHVASTKDVVAATSLNNDGSSTIAVSVDAGKTWSTVTPPATSKQILALAVDGDGGLWIGDRDTIFYSTDKGATWTPLAAPIVRNVTSLYYDQAGNRILLTARVPAKKAFAIDPATQAVTSWDTGWNMRFVRPVGSYLIGATLFDGIVVQPRMVDSALATKP